MTRALALAAGIALAASAAACGGAEREPNLAKAIERTESTGSSRIEIWVTDVERSAAVETTCEGTADYAHRRFRIACDDRDDSGFELIALGDALYVRARVGERWEKRAGEEGSLQLFSPEKLLARLPEASRETEHLGHELVRGHKTTRYRLSVDCRQLDLGCAGTTPVDVWLDGDGSMRRIEVENDGVTSAIEFFDFGVDVSIEAPPADQVATPADPGSQCSERNGEPITAAQVRQALRKHGFTVRSDRCPGVSGLVAVMTNDGSDSVLEREGIVFCHVHETPRKSATSTVDRRGVDGADAELRLANLTCTILADSPNSEEKIDPLEEAFEELERAIRP